MSKSKRSFSFVLATLMALVLVLSAKAATRTLKATAATAGLQPATRKNRLT